MWFGDERPLGGKRCVTSPKTAAEDTSRLVDDFKMVARLEKGIFSHLSLIMESGEDSGESADENVEMLGLSCPVLPL